MLPLGHINDLQRSWEFLLQLAQSQMSTEERDPDTVHTHDHSAGQELRRKAQLPQHYELRSLSEEALNS